MGYKQSVLQRRLCTNSPSAHLRWCIQGDASDPLVAQCPSHHLHYLSSKMLLIFKVVCRHRSCIRNGSAVLHPRAEWVWLGADLHRCWQTTAGPFGSALPASGMAQQQPSEGVASSNSFSWSNLTVFGRTTLLPPWSDSAHSSIAAMFSHKDLHGVSRLIQYLGEMLWWEKTVRLLRKE